jgi:hypothetical protein
MPPDQFTCARFDEDGHRALHGAKRVERTQKCGRQDAQSTSHCSWAHRYLDLFGITHLLQVGAQIIKPNGQSGHKQRDPYQSATIPEKYSKGLGKVLALQAKFGEWEAKDIHSEGLVFKIQPLAEGGPPPLPKKYHINSGPYALDPNSPYNTEFLTFKMSLYDYLVEAGDLPRYEETDIFVDGLKAAVDEKINWLEEKKLVEWKRQSKQTKADHVYSGELPSILEAVAIIVIQLSNRW